MSATTRPLVTVGVPVYNGQRYLERAVRSLLGQTLADFELIIADNASTDGTAELCQELMRSDPRVRAIRHARNIGAPRNWNCLVNEARGEFFKWATASDWCAPNLLERCVDTLRAEPGTVLCYGHTQLTDELEAPIEVYGGDIDVTMPSASARFRAVCTRLKLNNAMCGVVRTDVLRRTGMDRLYPSGDMALTSELALHGCLRLLPDVLQYRRQSKDTFTSMQSPMQVQRMYDPGATRPMRFILVRRHLDNFGCIWRAPIGAVEKARTAGVALHLLASDRVSIWQELRAAWTAESPAA